MIIDSLNINTYIPDGFVKVCDVAIDPDDECFWIFTNIDESVMFDTHQSWLYTILVDLEIVKLGETGQPLGIKMADGQPKIGTQCRLGRYRRQKGDGDTDATIRRALVEEVKAGRVSIWARKCQCITIPVVIGGVIHQTAYASHKDLEKKYLRNMMEIGGKLPRLNKGHI